ncbi:hypothetical protein [Halocola ammonii]
MEVKRNDETVIIHVNFLEIFPNPDLENFSKREGFEDQFSASRLTIEKDWYGNVKKAIQEHGIRDDLHIKNLIAITHLFNELPWKEKDLTKWRQYTIDSIKLLRLEKYAQDHELGKGTLKWRTPTGESDFEISLDSPEIVRLILDNVKNEWPLILIRQLVQRFKVGIKRSDHTINSNEPVLTIVDDWFPSPAQMRNLFFQAIRQFCYNNQLFDLKSEFDNREAMVKCIVDISLASDLLKEDDFSSPLRNIVLTGLGKDRMTFPPRPKL